MKRHTCIFDQITADKFVQAAHRAAKDHDYKREVYSVMCNLDYYVEYLYADLLNNDYLKNLHYRKMCIRNKYGQVREVDSPDFITRIYQYVFLGEIEPIYAQVDPMLAVNCKVGGGITSKNKKLSVVKRVKHLFYDCRNSSYAVIADQRQCYKHISTSVFRRKLRRLIADQRFTDFAVNVCFVQGRLPIGTPSSPMVHHLLMLDFDLWLKHEYPLSVRYADDVLALCESKTEAQTLKWRIKNRWWYELGLRSKRSSTRIQPLTQPMDFCGYVFHRNLHKTHSSHNKGYTSIRSRVHRSAWHSTRRNWGCYYGLLKHADTFAEMVKIEQTMDLQTLTQKIRIDRRLDAPTISVKELADNNIEFNVYDYEIRQDAQGNLNWIKCLIGIPVADGSGNLTGQIEAYEFHGNYQYLIELHSALEEVYNKKELLPITRCMIVNQCGYIYRNSTNQLKYINNETSD